MTLTGDTITDDQIRALRARLGSETYAGSSNDATDCDVAIAAPIGSLRRAQARARCAEILNAAAQPLLTADTITDTQICELLATDGLSAKEREDCEHALRKRDRHWTRFQRNMQHGARARCAQILNARTPRSP